LVRYRLNHSAGGKLFFTLTPPDRRSTVLVDHGGAVRCSLEQIALFNQEFCRVGWSESGFPNRALNQRREQRKGIISLLKRKE
jgi:hypothetical protein